VVDRNESETRADPEIQVEAESDGQRSEEGQAPEGTESVNVNEHDHGDEMPRRGRRGAVDYGSCEQL